MDSKSYENDDVLIQINTPPVSEGGKKRRFTFARHILEFTLKFLFVTFVSLACIYIIVNMEQSCHASTAFGLLLTVTGAILTGLKAKEKR